MAAMVAEELTHKATLILGQELAKVVSVAMAAAVQALASALVAVPAVLEVPVVVVAAAWTMVKTSMMEQMVVLAVKVKPVLIWVISMWTRLEVP